MAWLTALACALLLAACGEPEVGESFSSTLELLLRKGEPAEPTSSRSGAYGSLFQSHYRLVIFLSTGVRRLHQPSSAGGPTLN